MENGIIQLPRLPNSTTSLINNLVNQNVMAFKIIQSYMNHPSIANVTIYEETLTKTYPTDISKQVIIDTGGGRQVIHDNFALNPIGWKLKGYLKAESYEMSFYFQPSLKSQVKKLEEARNTRDVVNFKDKYGKTFKVGIEQMEIEENAECQNGIPISFTLVDVTQQVASSAIMSESEKNAIPKQGDDKGTTQDQGTIGGIKQTFFASLLDMFGGKK
jgi:hypothetical protein